MALARVLSGTLMLQILVLAASKFPYTGAEFVRLCPEGYFYSGDDEVTCNEFSVTTQRTYWTEEVGSSPVYSCYRHMAGKGFNDAYRECRQNKEAEIVAFETPCEAKRFFRQEALSQMNEDGMHEDKNKNGSSSMTVLTSAQYYGDIDKWVWLGSDPSINPVVYNVVPNANRSEQCLAVTGTWRAVENDQSGGQQLDIELVWKAVPCNSNITFACEVRSRTVTMVTWFYTNWITISLMFLVMVLIVSLCVSAITHTRSRSAAGAHRTVYRSQHNTRSGVVVGVVNSSGPVNDDPPKYSDVAGLENQTQQQEDSSNGSVKTSMDKCVGKGKELLGKIYLYKS